MSCGCDRTIDAGSVEGGLLCLKQEGSQRICRPATGWGINACPSDAVLCEPSMINNPTCVDNKPLRRCQRKQARGKCRDRFGAVSRLARRKCARTCGTCF